MSRLREECEFTHQQLIAGSCPWCNEYIHQKEIATIKSGEKKRVDEWDIDSLMRGLDSPELKNRITTIANVLTSTNTRFVDLYLPFYEKALTNSNYDICWRMTMILSRVGVCTAPPEATRIEELVTNKQTLLSPRIVLLSYHSHHRFHSASSGQAYERHLLWIIRNRPDCPISCDEPIHTDECNEGTFYQNARRIWLEHLQLHGDNLTILFHAAKFFIISERNLSEKLLKRCCEIDPSNPLWNRSLGRLYDLDAVKCFDTQGHSAAEKSVLAYQTALQNSTSNVERADLFIKIACASIKANDFQTALTAASQAMIVELPSQVGPFRAVILHRAKNIMGLAALSSGDIESAKDYLMRSVASIGVLSGSHVPYTRLARELLVKGERDVVLAFLRECTKLWSSEDHQLEKWIYALEQGDTPVLEFPGSMD